MELTPPQRRTLERLIGIDERPGFEPTLAAELRERIERAVGDRTIPGGVWITKGRLQSHSRCEGALAADVLGERERFTFNAKTAAGSLLHRAIQADIGGREERDPTELVRYAVSRISADDDAFAEFWRGLSDLEQDEMVMEAVRLLDLFRATFPPLREMRADLAPMTELPVRAEVLGGAVVLSGRVDLCLGRPAEGRATRLLLDLKTGNAYPEHAEDMRFYALAATLRFGVPPYRVASVFLESGEWQAEDVSLDILEHAADRVAAVAVAAADLVDGREPSLTPGVWCGWCPRSSTCPQSAA